MVPRRRFELLRAYAHHPLKMACLPIPPPRPVFRLPEGEHSAGAYGKHFITKTLPGRGINGASLGMLTVPALPPIGALKFVFYLHAVTPENSWQEREDSNPRPAVLETAALAN